ncbi:MAG: dTMP kinase [Clostridia bacterium]|nr:dTMP kinase [Clostridia bacterium]
MDRFISIEGCEGVGKSTQVKYLKEYLEATGQQAVFTREPGGTPVAEKIRDIILKEQMSELCEAHLFAAARIEHIKQVILPATSQGKLVVCDRFIDSSLAYQGYARGLGAEKIMEINDFAVKNCMPQCTVFIDMNPLNSWRKQKGKVIDDRMEEESAEFHLAVYEGFKKLVELYPERFICIVPQEDKLLTAESIVEALRTRGIIR